MLARLPHWHGRLSRNVPRRPQWRKLVALTSLIVALGAVAQVGAKTSEGPVITVVSAPAGIPSVTWTMPLNYVLAKVEIAKDATFATTVYTSGVIGSASTTWTANPLFDNQPLTVFPLKKGTYYLRVTIGLSNINYGTATTSPCNFAGLLVCPGT